MRRLLHQFLLFGAVSMVLLSDGKGWAQNASSQSARLPSERPPIENSLEALQSLRQEVRQPTPGPHTEVATRHHRKLQILLNELYGHQSFRPYFDLPTLQRATQTAAPGEEKDVLVLFLGILGDEGVTDQVARYLANPRNPAYLRAVAAVALGHLKKPHTVELLIRVAERDPVWESVAKRAVINSRNSNYKSFVVRIAAMQALSEYERNGLLPAHVKDRKAKVLTRAEFEE